MTDAEMMALGAIVQADTVDIECENKMSLAQAEALSRVNETTLGSVERRSVYDTRAYQRLVEELRRREVLR